MLLHKYVCVSVVKVNVQSYTITFAELLRLQQETLLVVYITSDDAFPGVVPPINCCSVSRMPHVIKRLLLSPFLNFL